MLDLMGRMDQETILQPFKTLVKVLIKELNLVNSDSNDPLQDIQWKLDLQSV